MKCGFIGAAIGACAGIEGCEKAPSLLATAEKLNFQSIFVYEGSARDYKVLAAYFSKLGQAVSTLAHDHFPIVIGGDHSCAIGTWSGLHQHHADIGLIWVDAHMDSHTPETSPSGNIHGMPLAALLGYGDANLTQVLGHEAKLKPENVVLVGIRSYEPAEEALLKKLGVKIYFMEEILQQGIEQILMNAFNDLATRVPVGLSIDMDAFDPNDAPGVGTPAENGISLAEFIAAIGKIDRSACCGIEIVEYNPDLDHDSITQTGVMRLVQAFQGH